MRLVFIAIGINFGDQFVEIRVRAQRPFGNEFLTTGGTFLVAIAQGGGDAIVAEAMETFFGRHRTAQHVQTDRTHELGVKTSSTDCNFGVGFDYFLWRSVLFVKTQLPASSWTWIGTHLLQWTLTQPMERWISGEQAGGLIWKKKKQLATKKDFWRFAPKKSQSVKYLAMRAKKTNKIETSRLIVNRWRQGFFPATI